MQGSGLILTGYSEVETTQGPVSTRILRQDSYLKLATQCKNTYFSHQDIARSTSENVAPVEPLEA